MNPLDVLAIRADPLSQSSFSSSMPSQSSQKTAFSREVSVYIRDKSSSMLTCRIVGWGRVQMEPGFGAQHDASMKARVGDLISSVRTVMRSMLSPVTFGSIARADD